MKNEQLDDLLIQEMVEENVVEEITKENSEAQKFADEQMAKYKQATMQSATNMYLILGIVYVVFAIVLEIIGWGVVDNIGVAFILQIPVALCLLMATSAIDWFDRREFTMYFVRISDDVSVKYIKENFAIMDINAHAIVFVKPEDEKAYLSWALLQSEDNIYHLEIKYFM